MKYSELGKDPKHPAYEHRGRKINMGLWQQFTGNGICSLGFSCVQVRRGGSPKLGWSHSCARGWLLLPQHGYLSSAVVRTVASPSPSQPELQDDAAEMLFVMTSALGASARRSLYYCHPWGIFH